MMKIINLNILYALLLLECVKCVKLDHDLCETLEKNQSLYRKPYEDYDTCEVKNRFSHTDKTVINNIDIFKEWINFPSTFIPLNNANDQCIKDSENVYRSARNLELWAFKMFDSSAKLPSGILSGNINQYGDFDQCINIVQPIKSKYCLASLDVAFKGSESIYHMDQLIHSHRWIKNNLTDFGHRVPKVSTIYWGVCLPASCSAKELENSMKRSLKYLDADVIADENLCVVKNEGEPLNQGKIITLILFIVVIICVFYGDDNDHENNSTCRKIIGCFSLKRNIKKLLNTQSDEEVLGLDGIRGLNALGLFLAHKSISLFFNPYLNRTHMSEIFSQPWAVAGRTAIIYTDSFMLISGFLSARNLLKDIKIYGRMNFKDKLISRLFRILPNFIAIILFCTYLLPDMGSGPLWGSVINEHSRLCKKNMWKNILFIHNYMGFENMCLTHTHQLGIDMQLFIATPIAIELLWRSSSNGGLVLLIVAILSTLLRLLVTITKRVSMVVYFGKSINQFWDSANYSYILPTHRATIYIIGIGLAYFMTMERHKINLTKIRLCWIIGVSLGLISGFGPIDMALSGYEYNIVKVAFYNMFLPIMWGIFVSWVIWACNNDCAGWFGKFLSWRGFRIFTKLSYGVYLIQFPVFFYSVGTQRHSDYYSISKMINVPEMCFILLASTLLALSIEIPFNNIYRVLFDKKKDDINRNKVNEKAIKENLKPSNINSIFYNYEVLKNIR